MTDNQGASTSTFRTQASDINSNMSDSQLRHTWTQIATAANATYASPTPQTAAQSKAYMKNLNAWSTSTPQRGNASSNTRGKARTTRTSTHPPTPQPYTPPVPLYQSPAMHLAPIVTPGPPNPPRAPLPTQKQALESTYSSRLRTGATLLMQPIFATTTVAGTRTSRRGAVVSYADPGSGDDLPDAGAIDSDDSDFVGGRSALRQTRSRVGASTSTFNATTGTSSTPRPAATPVPERAELDQSYLGMTPPAKFIKSRKIVPTPYDYPIPDVIYRQAEKRTALVPVRVEFETDTHRIRDCFTWNINETTITPESFARIFCNDLDLPVHQWVDTIANQIRAQLEEYEGVASMNLGQDSALDVDAVPPNGEEIAECRVILSIDVQIANHHLVDHIEWDLLSPLTPELFAQKLCTELGLTGEAVPLVAHAVHEEIMKHKKDAIEWGVIGGDRDAAEEGATGTGEKVQRDRTGLVKDKTGLGLGWGRAPKDGRGPKTLKSIWRDWAEAEEFRTKFEVLTAEEVERREIERERASRRLRRETSKFQSSTRSRRR
ncbi:hypothetical protein BDQ17DRAFT_1343178 [Cyathus striatus]|nr:hypothetical protein BDQ17DRAFT_1343178 [Cyathus striatus]